MFEVTKENFQQEVVEYEGHVVLDFWGPNCVPCKQLLPYYEQIATTYGDKAKFGKVNVQLNRKLCVDLRVISVPAFLIFHGGKEVSRLAGGDLTPQALKEFISKNLQ